MHDFTNLQKRVTSAIEKQHIKNIEPKKLDILIMIIFL